MTAYETKKIICLVVFKNETSKIRKEVPYPKHKSLNNPFKHDRLNAGINLRIAPANNREVVTRASLKQYLSRREPYCLEIYDLDFVKLVFKCYNSTYRKYVKQFERYK